MKGFQAYANLYLSWIQMHWPGQMHPDLFVSGSAGLVTVHRNVLFGNNGLQICKLVTVLVYLVWFLAHQMWIENMPMNAYTCLWIPTVKFLYFSQTLFSVIFITAFLIHYVIREHCVTERNDAKTRINYLYFNFYVK